MKNLKKAFTILLGVAVLVSFASCKKAGVYSPKKKIQKIYYSSTYCDKYLEEMWNWSNNKLMSINHFNSDGSLSWIENFSYDGNRIVRVDDLGDEYVTFDYDGNHLSTVNYFEDYDLESSFAVVYEGNKISTITVTRFDNFKKETKRHLSPLSYLILSDLCTSVDRCQEKLAVQRGIENGVYTTIIQFTWDGNNVVKTVVVEGGYTETLTMEYDDKNNPRTGLLSLDMGEEVMASGMNSSKNNITRITNTDSHGDGDVLNYVYQYNSEKFPTMQTISYSYSSYQSTYYFEY